MTSSQLTSNNRLICWMQALEQEPGPNKAKQLCNGKPEFWNEERKRWVCRAHHLALMPGCGVQLNLPGMDFRLTVDLVQKR